MFVYFIAYKLYGRIVYIIEVVSIIRVELGILIVHKLIQGDVYLEVRMFLIVIVNVNTILRLTKKKKVLSWTHIVFYYNHEIKLTIS